MKQRYLHRAYAGTTLATLLVALSAEPASAHLELRPRLVEQGAVTEVRVELPQLRPGGPPRTLEIDGAGVAILSVGLLSTAGSETAWNVRLRADGDPGVVALVLRAVYADGESVEVDEELTVAPAPPGSDFPWPALVVGALLAVAFAGVALHLARRKA